jgi:curved DNA-binding protein CbpA
MPPLKDHYQTLELSMQASLQEIKDAYRKLARMYHPDKHADPSAATGYFQDIQEAYSVLSNDYKRKNYDNELRLAGRYERRKKESSSSATQLVEKSETLYKQVASMQNARINYDALAEHIVALLSEQHIALLRRYPEAHTYAAAITHNILKACKPMHATLLFTPIKEQLDKLNADNPGLLQQAQEAWDEKYRAERMHRMVPLATVGIVLLVALIMFLLLRLS